MVQVLKTFHVNEQGPFIRLSAPNMTADGLATRGVWYRQWSYGASSPGIHQFQYQKG